MCTRGYTQHASLPPPLNFTLPLHRSPLGAHALVGGDVDGVRQRLMADGQAEVGDGAHEVLLDQDILGLEVAVSDAWLPCRGRRSGGQRIIAFDETTRFCSHCGSVFFWSSP